MAQVVVTIRVIPESPEIDINNLELAITKEILKFIDKVDKKFVKCDIKPFAFGLNSLDFMFVMDESRGSTDDLEETLRNIEGAQGVEVTDVRRTLG
jgi:elongation factor 1-beta